MDNFLTERFQEQVFFTTARILIDSDESYSTGTGFLFNARLNKESEGGFILLISNKHVFKNKKGKFKGRKGEFTFQFNRRKDDGFPDFGNVTNFIISDMDRFYFEHPDPKVDLACIDVTGITEKKYDIYYKTVSDELLATFKEDALMPELDVSFIGYPNSIYDEKNCLPLSRRGYISSLPKVDYGGKKQFIIDAQVFGGSSGSPVFAKFHGHHKLLGVLSQVLQKDGKIVEISTERKDERTLGVKLELGLGVVLKTELVIELVDFALSRLKELMSEQNKD